jgi:hypothetical protein
MLFYPEADRQKTSRFEPASYAIVKSAAVPHGSDSIVIIADH